MNVLFAWELGANFGHLAKQLAVARGLAARGHHITFAVRDTGLAAKLIAPYGYRFIQAPLMVTPPRLRTPPASYSEILLVEGFHDAAALAGRVQAWRHLFELTQPDVILIDHAPTALLAAQIAGVPRVVVGNGFEIPPAQSPYPNFRTWEAVADSRLIKSESLVLANINLVCRAHRYAPLHAVHEIFSGAAQALITLPEFDHYGARDTDYLGLIEAPLAGKEVEWPQGEGKRILIYLRPEVSGFQALVNVLKARNSPAILIAPGAPQAWVAQHATHTFSIQTEPIQIAPLLQGCDLGISYGSGTVCQLALAGVPQLILPKYTEQYLCGLRIQELGAGILVEKARTAEDLAQKLHQALEDPSLTAAARDFAARYANFKADRVAANVAQIAEQHPSRAARVPGQASMSGAGLAH